MIRTVENGFVAADGDCGDPANSDFDGGSDAIHSRISELDSASQSPSKWPSIGNVGNMRATQSASDSRQPNANANRPADPERAGNTSADGQAAEAKLQRAKRLQAIVAEAARFADVKKKKAEAAVAESKAARVALVDLERRFARFVAADFDQRFFSRDPEPAAGVAASGKFNSVDLIDVGEPEAWKYRPTQELELETVEGVSVSLAMDIYSRIPRVGMLAEMLKETTGRGAGLRRFKGVGAGKAEAIAERVRKWKETAGVAEIEVEAPAGAKVRGPAAS